MHPQTDLCFNTPNCSFICKNSFFEEKSAEGGRNAAAANLTFALITKRQNTNKDNLYTING